MKTDNIIEGNPTKKFFIEMITRDISIEDAIIDLLDNSIDGANRLNSEDYSGLSINITINESEFVIEDNCGGFSLDIAKRYAFRFGRPDDAPPQKASIGRFGIGMKRALFKSGKKFEVETQTEQDHFKVVVNVDEWSKQQTRVTDEITHESKIIDDWNFHYIINNDSRNSYNGTKIYVSDLNDEVKTLFKDDAFKEELFNKTQRLLNFSLLKGLKIILNGRALEGEKIELLCSDKIIPYYDSGVIGNVTYRIVAGLGEVGDPKRSGWYVFCNNRLVLEADQTSATYWGVGPTPQWHNNHVMFRGLLYLDSEETMDLPLTTTKKGIDVTSEVYRKLAMIMQEAMSSVLNFLKMIPRLEDPNGYRKMLCERSERKSAGELKIYDFGEHPKRSFTYPELDLESISVGQDTVRIAFDADRGLADNAKKHAGARSFKEFGKILFDYYMHMEGIDDEES